jgi:hypothetical protein
MLERRQSSRIRCLIGARTVFNGRNSTLSCTIRNYSEEGAQLLFGETPYLPDHLEVLLDNRRMLVPAQVVWRKGPKVGVIFPRGRFMAELREDADKSLAMTLKRADDAVLH